jgi:hypothetical protein
MLEKSWLLFAVPGMVIVFVKSDLRWSGSLMSTIDFVTGIDIDSNKSTSYDCVTNPLASNEYIFNSVIITIV